MTEIKGGGNGKQSKVRIGEKEHCGAVFQTSDADKMEGIKDSVKNFLDLVPSLKMGLTYARAQNAKAALMQ